MIKKVFLVGVAVFILSGCTMPGASMNSTPISTIQKNTGTENKLTGDITVSNFAFSPVSLSVKAGQKVVVVNNDSVPHTVTSDDGKSFETGTINPGQSGSFIAPTSGNFGYHCNIHRSMKANLVVK